MPTVTCPSCGDVDDLRGRTSETGVLVECGACGHSWRRDLTPTCTLCGSTDLEGVPTATLEEAGRGEQRTPSGIRTIYRCYGCGAHDATSASPVPTSSEADGRPLVTRSRVREAQLAAEPARRSTSRRVESAFGVFAAGETVGGQWTLQELVHWASTGSLWRAVEDQGHRQVLFKLIHPRLTRERRRAALHASAAHAAIGVRHPHLVPVLDVKTLAGDVLIVARSQPGAVLSSASTLPRARLVEVGRHLASALAALHEAGVPHLDVRPGKILVGDRDTRLLDLGAGRVRAAQRARETADHRLAFRAPEQVLAQDHSPAADVYSLGLTLWSLAGGDLGSMGADAAAQVRYRLTNDVPALDHRAVGLGPRITELLAAATRRSVSRRPSAAELAGQFELQ